MLYTPYRTTADGFDLLRLGTDHLGHFALTALPRDLLPPALASRVVTVSSAGHRMGGPSTATIPSGPSAPATGPPRTDTPSWLAPPEGLISELER
ncbi:hypothetical protein [Streptomyces sp. 142MFCol3.1]|uniref:hypothetical protein n=1 Tax=Streptomyces sp. 142MFCol3.1 TaxID=1172179 RepID=UPI0004291A0C|nr:hypothetical protein [Streptomyces sp. 142MFCol3.1]